MPRAPARCTAWLILSVCCSALSAQPTSEVVIRSEPGAAVFWDGVPLGGIESDGEFVIRGAPLGQFSVRIEKQGFVSRTEVIVRRGSGQTRLEIQLEAITSITPTRSSAPTLKEPQQTTMVASEGTSSEFPAVSETLAPDEAEKESQPRPDMPGEARLEAETMPVADLEVGEPAPEPHGLGPAGIFLWIMTFLVMGAGSLVWILRGGALHTSDTSISTESSETVSWEPQLAADGHSPESPDDLLHQIRERERALEVEGQPESDIIDGEWIELEGEEA